MTSIFRPQPMYRVELVIPESQVVPITEELADSGVFYLARPDYLLGAPRSRESSDWEMWADAFSTLERRVLAVMESLHVNEGLPPTSTPHLITPEIAERDVAHLEEEMQAPVHELEAEQHRLTQLQRSVSQLEPLVGLDVDLGSLRNLRYTFVMLGTIPKTNVERLQSSLEHVPHVLVELNREAHLVTVVLFGMQEDAEILGRAARSAYLNPLTPPKDYRGTPVEAIAALQEGIERTRQHIAQYEETIARLRRARIRHLHLLLWRLRASRHLVEAIATYGRLHYTYLISGWVPTSQVEHLRAHLLGISEDVIVEVSPPRPEEGAEIPAVLPERPHFLDAFHGLVTNYGYPRYAELDPTPIMALTFPLVFGIMFGDVGHGLLLAFLGWLISSRKVNALHGMASLGPIVVACGISSMLFGFLYGSIFGFEDLLPAIWLRPLEDIMGILIATVAIGVGILSLGIVYNILNALMARDWGELLFGHQGLIGLIFYWALLGLAASAFAGELPVSSGIFVILAAATGLVVTFSEPLERLVNGVRPLVEDELGTYLMQALFELFETVISLLSNTLSYVRMGAFAVAHGALSLVIFILAELISPSRGIGYWLVVLLGNLFIIGFEGIIVSIQTLRLEYYEFFSKFFKGNGEPHHPFTLVPPERGG